MTRKLLIGFVINALFLFAAQGASFDCTRASGFVEKTICTDKTLSELDSLLDTTYRKAIEEAELPAQVRQDQKAWIKQTRSACDTVSCLQQSYRQRIADLIAIKTVVWKTFSDPLAAIEFIYPGNRSVQVEQNHIKVLEPVMPDGSEYIIHFETGEGDFAKAIEKSGVFEERAKDEWIATIGRFENKPAEKIAGAGWSGLKTTITCGVSDQQGFHAAGGECLWAVISDGRHYLVADTQGISGLDADTLKTLMSIKFTPQK